MLLQRRFAAATACLPIAGGFFLLLAFAGQSPAIAASEVCPTPAEVTVLPSPQAPWTGVPLRVMVVIDDKPAEGVLSLIAPDGSVAVKSAERHGGSASFLVGEGAGPAAGNWHARLEREGASDCPPISREITVAARKPEPVRVPAGSIWQVRNSWNATNEALFSAWIEKLFDAPADQNLDWKVWYEVLRDQSRNFLYNYLGRNEDHTQTSLRPDCADFVYFLRAYFAFKMGLPFGYSNCSRGFGGRPPKCMQWFDVEHLEVTRPPPPPEQVVADAAPIPVPPEQSPGMLGLFGRSQPPGDPMPGAPAAKAPPPKPKRPTNFAEYLRDVGDVVHTGAVRAGDDSADFYTVPLTQQALRPGTVYADPYGHVLMIVRRVPEAN